VCTDPLREGPVLKEAIGGIGRERESMPSGFFEGMCVEMDVSTFYSPHFTSRYVTQYCLLIISSSYLPLQALTRLGPCVDERHAVRGLKALLNTQIAVSQQDRQTRVASLRASPPPNRGVGCCCSFCI